MIPFTTTPQWSVKRLVLLGLFLLPIITYLIFIGIFSYNLPIFDDYILLVETERLLSAPHFFEKATILFSQLNEHRLVYTRFWFWIVTLLNGSLSFKVLIWIGNASLLGITWLIYRQGRRLALPKTIWLPIGWLLFQFQFYANSLWAMASLQNLTIHFLYLLLFVLILKRTRIGFIFACSTASLLVYTSGNGIIAPILCTLVFFYQKRYRELGIWLLLIIGLLAAYAFHYQTVRGLQQESFIPLHKWLFGVLIFLGLVAKFSFVSPLILALTGTLLVLTALILTALSIRQLIRYDRKRQLIQPAHALMAICILTYGFLFASAIAVVQGRWGLNGWHSVIEVRYCLYSTMWLVVVYMHTIALLAVSENIHYLYPGYGIILGGSILYWGLTFQYNLAGMYEFRDRALSDYYNWTQTQSPQQQELIAKVFQPSGIEEAYLYSIDQGIHQDTLQTISLLPASVSTIPSPLIQRVSQDEHSESFSISEVGPGKSLHDWRYLIMNAGNHTLLMPCSYRTNTDAINFWLAGQWFRHDLNASALTFFTENRPYRIGLLMMNKNKTSIYYSDHYLIPQKPQTIASSENP